MLEAFNGSNYQPLSTTGVTSVLTGMPRQALLEQSYDALVSSVYGALAMQTRLKPYLDEIGLTICASGVKLDFSAMEAANDFEWRRRA